MPNYRYGQTLCHGIIVSYAGLSDLIPDREI